MKSTHQNTGDLIDMLNVIVFKQLTKLSRPKKLQADPTLLVIVAHLHSLIVIFVPGTLQFYVNYH